MQEKIEQVIARIKDNKDFAVEFKKNPMDAIKGLLGTELTDDIVENIVTAVKAKLNVDQAEGILGNIKKLF